MTLWVNPASWTPEESWIQNSEWFKESELPLESWDKSWMDELEKQIVFSIEKIVWKKLT